MPETESPTLATPVTAGASLRCSKCNSRMNLARAVPGPSSFDLRRFECSRCDYARIVSVAIDPVSDDRSLRAKAIDALEEARAMPPGPQRTSALKKAGQLRRMADSQGLILPKRGRPRK